MVHGSTTFRYPMRRLSLASIWGMPGLNKAEDCCCHAQCQNLDTDAYCRGSCTGIHAGRRLAPLPCQDCHRSGFRISETIGLAEEKFCFTTEQVADRVILGRFHEQRSDIFPSITHLATVLYLLRMCRKPHGIS